MKKVIVFVTAFPGSVYAASSESLAANFFVSWAPIILAILFLWLVIRLIFGHSKRANERLVESNERIAKSLEELVTIVRKKE
jgi:uncharacterized membrane protein